MLPACPRSPQDKATAESSVQVVGRWVLARLRNHRFDTAAQVDAVIAELLPSVIDRPSQKLPCSRASVFAELNKPALMPLPAQSYEPTRFKTVKMQIYGYIAVDGHRYRVPHPLVGQVRQARPTQHASTASSSPAHDAGAALAGVLRHFGGPKASEACAAATDRARDTPVESIV